MEIALWGTQAGGLARWDTERNSYVWHEVPGWASQLTDDDPDRPKIGDQIHPEMDLIPANEAAHAEMLRA